MTRQVFGVQAQPAAAAADSFPDPGELNTDNCFLHGAAVALAAVNLLA
jgi:hypothetical protein